MKDLLKFITCGSVDDGKSTLIGHMLYDAKLIFADHERALELDSRMGSREGQIDYSLLLDGLMAEREQGITIDVAYRYFTTPKRSFIVADTPGHEQYTRNMAVGASFADLAVILVDARQGILPQTKRHARICALMGIRHFVLAVNKMDLISYNRYHFEEIARAFQRFAGNLGIESVHAIPVSASEGDNITDSSANTPWFAGSPLLPYLEEIDIAWSKQQTGFVIPVQRVCRPHQNFRGFQGQVESGNVRYGDELTVLPSGVRARVKGIQVGGQMAEMAIAGQPVTIQFDSEVDISRGCVLVKDVSLEIADMFTATLLWMDDAELIPGRNYFLKLGTRTIPAMVMNIKSKLDIDSGEHLPATHLFKNELAVCDLALSERLVFSSFKQMEILGSFILMDRLTNMTSACGIIEHSLRRSTNVVWQQTDITREMRAQQKQQRPITIWLTGLSGSGKSTLANEVEKRLAALNKHTMLLDGDNIRHGLNKNLGFREADRVENIRRVAEVAKLLNDAGLIVLTSFISPYLEDRYSAKEIIGGSNFIEVYVSTPLATCEARDAKGLYKKARSGEIPEFTGISSPYEKPDAPGLVIDTSILVLEEAVDRIMHYVLPLIEREASNV
jgi:bifunctional enzyme CysN/CysC